MTSISIDFSTLKYNLYEVLNVSNTADIYKIKKNFIKLIKNYHPDKNSELEEDIYQHIILANQILLNQDSRIKYDNYISNKNNDFNELKEFFNKSINNSLIDNKKSFENNFLELNKKHGYDENINNTTIIDNFINFKSSRNKDITIEKNIFKSNDEFNNQFSNNKLNNGKFSNQIIEYNDLPYELSSYVIGESYINLADIDKLYIEDSILSSNFSSLDKAFSMHPQYYHLYDNNLKCEDKIKEYKLNTNKLLNN
jgi:curved DNA-binding protein CbpA